MDPGRAVESAQFLPKASKRTDKQCASDGGGMEDRVTRLVCGAVFIAATFFAHLLTTGVSFSIGTRFWFDLFARQSNIDEWIVLDLVYLLIKWRSSHVGYYLHLENKWLT